MKTIYHTFQSLFLCLICFVGFTSCEKEDRTYQGPVYYEFSPDKNGQTVSGSNNLIVKETSTLGEDTVCVQMIRKNTKPTTVRFHIADQLYFIKSDSRFVTDKPDGLNESAYEIHKSTAEYGVDFVFNQQAGVVYDPQTKSGAVTIEAGEMFAHIPINILVRNNTTAYIVLDDTNNAQVNKPTGLLALQILSVKTVHFSETFKTGIPATWGNIDKDGDGYKWEYTTTDGGFAMSRSYISSDGALTPENYLISPAITVPANALSVTLSYDISASARNAYQEQYQILISEEPITEANCRNATVLKDWTELTDAHKYWNVVTTTTRLEGYAGKTFYIAFLHGNCTDMDRFLLKNVVVYGF